MKKTFRMIGMALVTILMAVGMAACGSDDDEGEPADPATHDSELLGTWYFEDEESEYSTYQEVTFRKDGTGKVYEEEEEDGDVYKYSFDFTWSTSNGNLKMTATSGEDKGEVYNFTYSIDGDVAHVEGMTWYKK